MPEPSNDNIITQTLEMPKKEGKMGIFDSYLQLRLTIAQVMKDSNYTPTDSRVNDLVNLMISGIPNLKKQQSLRDGRDKRIFEETKNLTTNEEKGRKIQQINIELAGQIAPYMDMYTGGERANRISFIIPIKEMRLIMEAANPEHFREHLDEIPIEIDED
jgi:hypothetical protein